MGLLYGFGFAMSSLGRYAFSYCWVSFFKFVKYRYRDDSRSSDCCSSDCCSSCWYCLFEFDKLGLGSRLSDCWPFPQFSETLGGPWYRNDCGLSDCRDPWLSGVVSLKCPDDRIWFCPSTNSFVDASSFRISTMLRTKISRKSSWMNEPPLSRVERDLKA